jgi:hypothetical protein
MRTTRRSLLTGLGATALAGDALANPDAGQAPAGTDRGGGTFDSENTLDRIPLLFRDGYRFAVLYLMLVTTQQIFFFTALNAVFQRNENRLPVGRIPLLGQIFRPEYRRADFEAIRRIAIYYLLGSTMLIDLRPRALIQPVSNIDANWDRLEAKLAAEAQRPVSGEIMVEAAQADLSGPAQTLTVLHQDASYTMLLGGKAVSEGTRLEALPFLSNLPLLAHLFRKGDVVRKEKQLLVMVSPSVVERSWD